MSYIIGFGYCILVDTLRKVGRGLDRSHGGGPMC